MQLVSMNTQTLDPCCIGSVFYCFIDKLKDCKQVEAFWDAGSDALADVDAFVLSFFLQILLSVISDHDDWCGVVWCGVC